VVVAGGPMGLSDAPIGDTGGALGAEPYLTSFISRRAVTTFSSWVTADIGAPLEARRPGFRAMGKLTRYRSTGAATPADHDHKANFWVLADIASVLRGIVIEQAKPSRVKIRWQP